MPRTRRSLIEKTHVLLGDAAVAREKLVAPSLEGYARRHGTAHLLVTDRLTEASDRVQDVNFSVQRLKLESADHVLVMARDARAVASKQLSVDRGTAKAWARFLARHSGLIQQGTERWGAFKIFVQLAAEQPADSVVRAAIEAWLSSGACHWTWLRRARPVTTAELERRVVLRPPTGAADVAVVGQGQSLAALQHDGTTSTWRLPDGEVLAAHPVNARGAQHILPAGPELVVTWCTSGELYGWEWRTGRRRWECELGYVLRRGVMVGDRWLVLLAGEPGGSRLVVVDASTGTSSEVAGLEHMRELAEHDFEHVAAWDSEGEGGAAIVSLGPRPEVTWLARKQKVHQVLSRESSSVVAWGTNWLRVWHRRAGEFSPVGEWEVPEGIEAVTPVGTAEVAWVPTRRFVEPGLLQLLDVGSLALRVFPNAVSNYGLELLASPSPAWLVSSGHRRHSCDVHAFIVGTGDVPGRHFEVDTEGAVSAYMTDVAAIGDGALLLQTCHGELRIWTPGDSQTPDVLVPVPVSGKVRKLVRLPERDRAAVLTETGQIELLHPSAIAANARRAHACEVRLEVPVGLGYCVSTDANGWWCLWDSLAGELLARDESMLTSLVRDAGWKASAGLSDFEDGVERCAAAAMGFDAVSAGIVRRAPGWSGIPPEVSGGLCSVRWADEHGMLCWVDWAAWTPEAYDGWGSLVVQAGDQLEFLQVWKGGVRVDEATCARSLLGEHASRLQEAKNAMNVPDLERGSLEFLDWLLERMPLFAAGYEDDLQ